MNKKLIAALKAHFTAQQRLLESLAQDQFIRGKDHPHCQRSVESCSALLALLDKAEKEEPEEPAKPAPAAA